MALIGDSPRRCEQVRYGPVTVGRLKGAVVEVKRGLRTGLLLPTSRQMTVTRTGWICVNSQLPGLSADWAPGGPRGPRDESGFAASGAKPGVCREALELSPAYGSLYHL